MKVKRIVCVLVIGIICCTALALTAMASAEGTLTNYQVTMTGYVAGFNWPLAMDDTIYYNATISGENVPVLAPGTAGGGDSNKAYIQPKSDKITLSKIYMWDNCTTVMENDGVSCGSGVTKVSLKMYVAGSSKTISSSLD